MKVFPKLGDQESEILRYISAVGPAPVRDVAEYFEKEKGLARTTILTVMERLRKKGYLARSKVEGIFHYSEKIEAETFLKGRIADFIERTLGGSVSPLLSHFASTDQISAEEISKLKEIISAYEKKQGKS